MCKKKEICTSNGLAELKGQFQEQQNRNFNFGLTFSKNHSAYEETTLNYEKRMTNGQLWTKTLNVQTPYLRLVGMFKKPYQATVPSRPMRNCRGCKKNSKL
jgi:hypothetical protein